MAVSVTLAIIWLLSISAIIHAVRSAEPNDE